MELWMIACWQTSRKSCLTHNQSTHLATSLSADLLAKQTNQSWATARQVLFKNEMPVITVALTYTGIDMIELVIFFDRCVPVSLLPHRSIFCIQATPTHNTTTRLQGSLFEFNHSSPDDDSGVNSASIFSHVSQCEPDLGSSFSDAWNQIPFLFVSILLLCLYILYLKYCFDCTVGDTITYNGTLIKTRHFYYLYQNRMTVVWNTVNSDLLHNTSIKQ
jgi:hypothetical protein